MNRLANRSLRTVLFWRPIRRRDQFCFVEAFRQSLAANMEMDAAIMVAQEVNPSPRFRTALAEMARNVRHGYSLEQALTKTGVKVSGQLLAALRVEQDRGELIAMLGVVARGDHPNPTATFADLLGRPAVVRRFADTLAELLRAQHLTRFLIEDAVAVAGGQSRFTRHMADVVTNMENGLPLGEALRQQPEWFDPLFCRLVEVADHRELLRSVLVRLAGRDEAIAPSPRCAQSGDRGLSRPTPLG